MTHFDMSTTTIVLAALMLDACLGEPRRWHPLIGFGRFAQAIEMRLHANSRVRGIAATTLALLPPVLLTFGLAATCRSIVFDVVMLYLAIGWRSLEQHAGRVRDALQQQNLAAARSAVGLIVSRDTAHLDETDIAKATVESVLENGNDAIFGAIFWFVVAGVPGVVLYRLSNTLDAMWGYRNARYAQFGWAAARLDDLLNIIPARLTALSFAVVGHFSIAMHCWRHQAPHWKSPNAGPVMAAGAGALGVTLGGSACYHGAMISRPVLGLGLTAQASDIHRATRLIRRALMLWVAVLALAEGLLHV